MTEHPEPTAAADDSAASVEHHDPQTHMDAPTVISVDDHGHGEAVVGPVDVGGWIYALVGVGAGLVVVLFFWWAIT